MYYLLLSLKIISFVLFPQASQPRMNFHLSELVYLTKTTRMHFVVAFLFKLINPAEVYKKKRGAQENNKLKDSGICIKMTPSFVQLAYWTPLSLLPLYTAY